jgi:hypothetical protein
VAAVGLLRHRHLYHTQTPRRMPGYFGSTDAGSNSWRGALAAGADLSLYPPDAGPLAADPRRGVITVGAVPWIVNFNVPIRTDDVAAARRVARAVGERGGGLAGVEVGAGGASCWLGLCQKRKIWSARSREAQRARMLGHRLSMPHNTPVHLGVVLMCEEPFGCWRFAFKVLRLRLPTHLSRQWRWPTAQAWWRWRATCLTRGRRRHRCEAGSSQGGRGTCRLGREPEGRVWRGRLA